MSLPAIAPSRASRGSAHWLPAPRRARSRDTESGERSQASPFLRDARLSPRTPRLVIRRRMAMEALAVLVGWNADAAQKGAAHGLGRAETAIRGDRLQMLRALLEPAAGGLHAHRDHEPRRRHPDLAREPAGELARAHVHPAGELRDRQALVRMI